MEETNKTVEEQILNSDLVNSLRNEFGEKGEKMARKFIEADRESKAIYLVLLGWKALTGAGFLEGAALEVALNKLMKVAPLDTLILTDVLIEGFERIMQNDKEE